MFAGMWLTERGRTDPLKKHHPGNPQHEFIKHKAEERTEKAPWWKLEGRGQTKEKDDKLLMLITHYKTQNVLLKEDGNVQESICLLKPDYPPKGGRQWANL